MKKINKVILIVSIMVLTFVFPMSVNAAVKLNKKSITINVNKTYTLKLVGNTNKVKWTSSNRKVASVNSRGVVKGISIGTATIVAKAENGKYAKCKVKVTRKTWETIKNINVISCNRLEFCSSPQNDSFGNIYAGGNLIKLDSYGEAIWGEYGYSKSRIAYGEFALCNVYSRLIGKIAVSSETSNASVGGRLEIYGDGHLLEYHDLNRKTAPIAIDVDVTGINVLKISLVYRSKEGYGDVKILLDNMKLKSCNYRTVLPSKNTKLVDMNIINSYKNYTIIDDHTRTDPYGNTYSPENLLELSVYGESIWGNNGYVSNRTPYGEYCINKKYSNLSGIIAPSDMSDDVQGRFVIYGDNEEIFSKYINRTTMPANININVEPYTWIKFVYEFNSPSGAGTARMYIYNFIFR